MSSAPLVLLIQHFCIHDGPGVRSVVFLKGCPLRCSWCQNPESYSTEAEIGFQADRCIDCRRCVEACPHEARQAPGLPASNRCQRCWACVATCPSGALVQYGQTLSVDEVVQELRPEFALLRESGGGVTLSGGEPALQPCYCAELAERLQAEGIHMAMETCGQFVLERVEGLLARLDLVLFDLKLHAPAEMREHCGIASGRICNNLKALAEQARSQRSPRVWPRLPLVPGLTDTNQNLAAWADLLKKLDLPGITLIPHHSLGASKRVWLGLPPVPGYPPATPADLDRARDTLARHGATAFSPGEEDW